MVELTLLHLIGLTSLQLHFHAALFPVSLMDLALKAKRLKFFLFLLCLLFNFKVIDMQM
jgi:hypothetical protein